MNWLPPPHQLDRRAALRALGAGLTAATLGCRGSSESNRNANELRVFVYAGGHEKMMQEAFVPAFEKQTGAKVTLYSGWWDGIGKLKAAPKDDPPFDLLVTDATQGYPAAKEGLFAKINFDDVPNHRLLAPSVLENWIFREGWGLTYPDAVMTLAYNKTKVQTEPKRWADIAKEEYTGKIGLYSSFYMSLYTLAAVLADQRGRPGTAQELIRTDLDGVMNFAKEQRARMKLWWPTTTDMILSLANGECALGNMHSPEYLVALREKAQLGGVVPETDRAFVQVFWAIPAGTPKRELATQAINVLFSEEVQLGFSQRGSATAILSVAQKMAAADPFWKQLYPHTAQQFSKLEYYPYDLYAKHWDRLADEWDRHVLRKS